MRSLIFFMLILMAISLWSEWTVVDTYIVPEGACGLAYDGENLYCGIYGVNGDEFYQIDPSDGSYQLLFTVPTIGDCFGLSWDGEHLWTTDHPSPSSNPAIAIELDLSGNIVSQIELPDHYMSGIACEGEEFWVSTYYDPDGYIYRIDGEGSVLQGFTAPDNQPWDLCIEGEYLWMSDYWGDALYKIDKSDGSLLESHASEGVDPAGVVYDGEYLWYCDNGEGAGQDYLYKVDLGGGGNPLIELGFEEYDFGEVIVGETGTVDLPVSNNGSADLVITSAVIPSAQFSAIFQPPLMVEPGQTGYIGIMFMPDAWGEYNGVLEIGSNDPVHPLMEVNLSGSGVVNEPDIEIEPEEINFGTVRVLGLSGELIEVSNQGSQELVIAEVEAAGENFWVTGIEELPLTIGTNESVWLNVWFNPSYSMTYTGTLMITSNDPDESPYELSLSGTGEEQNFMMGETVWEYQITTGYDNSPKAIAAIGDVNLDDKEDVIICSEDGYTRCFNGNSSEWGDVIWSTDTGNVYRQGGLTITEDIDNDGYTDVAIGTSGARTIYLLSGLTGEILWEHDTDEYGDGGWVYQVDCSYDYNGDGRKDILAAVGNDGSGTGPQRVYCLDAYDGNSIWEFYTAGPKFSVIGVADMDGDDQPDVVAGASDGWETEGIVYGISGADGSQIWSYTVSGSSVWALLQLGDLNADGIMDVAAGDFSGNYYGLNGENGGILWNGNIGNSIILSFVGMGDVNGDGYADFSVAHSTFSSALVLDGYDGSVVWSQPVADQPWNLCRIDDLNGDGVSDVVVGTLFNNSYVYYLDGASGTEMSSVNVGTPVDALGVLADIDANGSMEVIAGGRNGWVYCYSGGSVSMGYIEGYVYNNNMQGLEGVIIDAGGVTAITDAEGYFFMQLSPGLYTLTAYLEGYNSVSMEVVVTENETELVEIILELIEELYPPENVTIDEYGLVSWTAPTGALYFNLYIEGEYLGQTTQTSFQLNDLEIFHVYEIGISAVYEQGESEIVIIGFIFTGGHQYGDIDDNDLVEALDAALVLQYVVGIDPEPYAPLPWTDWQLIVADVDGNEAVEAYDAALVLQFVVGIIETFPVELPLRQPVPEAAVSFEYSSIENALIVSASGELHGFSVQSLSAEMMNLPRLTDVNALMEFNREAQHLAIASAYPLEGEFLIIPLRREEKEIEVSLVVNTQKIECRIELTEENNLPEISELYQNHPNPFNPETMICFDIAEDEAGEFSIFNVKGQLLYRSTYREGHHEFRWRAESQSSGVYFYQLVSPSQRSTRKMLLLK